MKKGSEDMATKYEKYQLPVEPADPDAEFLTVQETAFVFRCSVPTIRRRCKELGLGSRVGARLVLDRDERREIRDASRNSATAKVPTQRRRRPAAKRTAAPKATASTTRAAA